MKQRSFFVLFLFFFAITFGNGCSDPASKRDFANVYSLSGDEKELIKPGDIIMRHGYGFVSNTIVKTLQEDYAISHAGIVVSDNQGGLRVVHSVSQTISDFDGVQDVDINTFVRDSQPNSIMVVRFLPSSENPESRVGISRRANYYLEQKIPFDYSFSLDDDTRFYCSEFIVRVLADIFGDSLFGQFYPANISGLEKLKFGIFIDPGLFEIVINHQQ
ncbi:MAG: hypothetical protein K0B37_02235 [Bacteroidales bacterium]|nr:hypothetical protein [Bacteroidales bacterium]